MSTQSLRKMVVIEEKYCYSEERELTVHKRSMFRQGDGFIVYDNNGDILFRVDSYSPSQHLLLLMDTFGHPLITLLPKRPTLHHRWEGFLGEKMEGEHQKPIFSIWKSMSRRSSVMVEVYNSDPPMVYQIEGCFSERRCIISSVGAAADDHHHDHDACKSKVTMAQIKQKVDPTRDIVFGKDVFNLILTAGFDGAFAMALVLALDRIDGDHDHIPLAC